MEKIIINPNNKVDRRFSAEWAKIGKKSFYEMPKQINSLLVQRKNMVKYIELLHDKIDELTNQIIRTQ